MSIMIKREKFEYLRDNNISKLIQKKAIFIEAERRMSISGFNILLLCFEMVSFLLKEINPYALRLINITLQFINSWNFSNRFTFYFKVKSKFAFMYFFLILPDISAIRSDLRSFFRITLHIMMFIMMNAVAVFCCESSSNCSFSMSTGRNHLEHII